MPVSCLALIVGRVGPVPFVDAVRSAQSIVMGRVERVVILDYHRFADIAVERTLKGPRRPVARFLAEPTWTCDVSDAHVGEKGMFLLWSVGPRTRLRDRNSTRSAAVRRAIENGPVYVLGAAGEGRIVNSRNLNPGKLGNSWYYGGFIMPHDLPPQTDESRKPFYSPDRLAYVVQRCLARAQSPRRTYSSMPCSRMASLM